MGWRAGKSSTNFHCEVFHSEKNIKLFLQIMSCYSLFMILDVAFHIDSITDKYYNRKLFGHLDQASTYSEEFKAALVSEK